MSKHPRPPFINHIDYIRAWRVAAEHATAADPAVPPPPDYLTAHFGPPHCPACWDTGLCPECYGLYPQYCPADCPQGTCDCPAGQARLAAYLASFAAHGLPDHGLPAPEPYR